LSIASVLPDRQRRAQEGVDGVALRRRRLGVQQP
jgi:hypothetical protein